MTFNRMSITLTTLIAAMFAALLIAALVGSNSPAGAANSPGSNGTSVLLPMHKAAKPVYAKTMYRPHQMCDEVHHKAIKSPAVNP